MEINRLEKVDETIDNWTELKTVHTFAQPAAREPIDAYVRGLHEELSKLCPTIVWNVIERQMPTETAEASILYEWNITNCPPEPDQHVIARVLYGKFNVFSLSYAEKTQALPPEKRDERIKALSEAKIVRS